MSKGEQLDLLLSETEKIHAQMTELFIKNNIPRLQLSLLPEDDRKKWQELHEKSNELGDRMNKLIMQK